MTDKIEAYEADLARLSTSGRVFFKNIHEQIFLLGPNGVDSFCLLKFFMALPHYNRNQWAALLHRYFVGDLVMKHPRWVFESLLQANWQDWLLPLMVPEFTKSTQSQRLTPLPPDAITYAGLTPPVTPLGSSSPSTTRLLHTSQTNDLSEIAETKLFNLFLAIFNEVHVFVFHDRTETPNQRITTALRTTIEKVNQYLAPNEANFLNERIIRSCITKLGIAPKKQNIINQQSCSDFLWCNLFQVLTLVENYVAYNLNNTFGFHLDENGGAADLQLVRAIIDLLSTSIDIKHFEIYEMDPKLVRKIQRYVDEAVSECTYFEKLHAFMTAFSEAGQSLVSMDAVDEISKIFCDRKQHGLRRQETVFRLVTQLKHKIQRESVSAFDPTQHKKTRRGSIRQLTRSPKHMFELSGMERYERSPSLSNKSPPRISTLKRASLKSSRLSPSSSFKSPKTENRKTERRRTLSGLRQIRPLPQVFEYELLPQEELNAIRSKCRADSLDLVKYTFGENKSKKTSKTSVLSHSIGVSFHFKKMIRRKSSRSKSITSAPVFISNPLPEPNSPPMEPTKLPLLRRDELQRYKSDPVRLVPVPTRSSDTSSSCDSDRKQSYSFDHSQMHMRGGIPEMPDIHDDPEPPSEPPILSLCSTEIPPNWDDIQLRLAFHTAIENASADDIAKVCGIDILRQLGHTMLKEKYETERHSSRTRHRLEELFTSLDHVDRSWERLPSRFRIGNLKTEIPSHVFHRIFQFLDIPSTFDAGSTCMFWCHAARHRGSWTHLRFLVEPHWTGMYSYLFSHSWKCVRVISLINPTRSIIHVLSDKCPDLETLAFEKTDKSEHYTNEVAPQDSDLQYLANKCRNMVRITIRHETTLNIGALQIYFKTRCRSFHSISLSMGRS